MIRALLTKKSCLCLCRGFFILLILLFVFSCATSDASFFEQRQYIPSEPAWQKIEGCDFADYFSYEGKDAPLRYHCLRIDLGRRISILTYPRTESDFMQKNGSKTDYFKGMTAKQFSERFDSAVTVNASPFAGKGHSSLSLLFSARKIIGIHVAEKKMLSPPVPRYGAVAFKKDGVGWKGKIFSRQDEDDFSEYDFAFGGFFTILANGEKEKFRWQSKDSRTAAGLSADGKTLYLLAVEGERRKTSTGLSYPECADILIALGATDALQLDGGHSTALYINKKNALSYSSSLKNAVFIGFK